MKICSLLFIPDSMIVDEKEEIYRELKMKLYGEKGVSREHLEYIKRVLIEPSRIPIK